MTSFGLHLVSAIAAVSLFGCARPDPLPRSKFRLTVMEIANDESVGATLFKIQTVGEASISVGRHSDHSSMGLSAPDSSGLREASVAVLASHFAPAGDENSYLQTLIRLSTPNGNFVGGPATYTLPHAAHLSTGFKVTAKSGVYSLNEAVEIARLQGEPVTLTIGKATR